MTISKHFAIVGVTASGKSALAMEIARAIPQIEIVSIDSMQVYRGMDIGTAKPTLDERSEVAHHLIDLVEPSQDFTLTLFQRAARECIGEIESRGHVALLVGGTALYLRTVIDDLTVPSQFLDVRQQLEEETDTVKLHAQLEQLDPLAASRMEPTNRRRIVRALEVTLGSGHPFSSYGEGLNSYGPTKFQMFGIWLPREVVNRRIRQRYETQLEKGFVEEVGRIFARDVSRTAQQALGYREIAEHVEGQLPLEQALELAINRTQRFARRQQAWFRRDPRIRWYGTTDNPVALVAPILEDLRKCIR